MEELEVPKLANSWVQLNTNEEIEDHRTCLKSAYPESAKGEETRLTTEFTILRM